MFKIKQAIARQGMFDQPVVEWAVPTKIHAISLILPTSLMLNGRN